MPPHSKIGYFANASFVKGVVSAREWVGDLDSALYVLP